MPFRNITINKYFVYDIGIEFRGNCNDIVL